MERTRTTPRTQQPAATITTHRLLGLSTVRSRYFGDEISDSMLRKLVAQGELPAVRVGARVMFLERDVEAYIERRRTA